MLNRGIDRLNAVFSKIGASRFFVLYGNAVEDSFISEDYIELGPEEAIWRTLKQQGYTRIIFISPHKAVYFLDEFSRKNSFPKSPQDLEIEKEKNNIRSGKMEFLKDGPLGELFILEIPAATPENALSYSEMGDVHAIRLLDTIMKDQQGPKSAVIFMQSETTLRYFDDQRTLAGIIGEWEQLPLLNENICLFLFSAADYQNLVKISENLPIPELRNAIHKREINSSAYYNVHHINGPDRQELMRLIKYVSQLKDIQIDANDLYQLSDWMAAEGLKVREWLSRIRDLKAINLIIAKKEGWFSSQRDPDLTINERITAMVGLKDIKERITELSAWLEVQKQRGDMLEFPLLHMMFLGNPGTGKTTFARLIGEIFHDLGLLKRGHLVEVKAGDLIAGHVGGTAIKTNMVIDKALDGVLFLDEAYMLTEKERGGFGQEALDTLLTRLENDRKRLVVIVAGYPDKMKKFRKANPGLARRFPEENIFEFSDYSAQELWEILASMLEKRGLGYDLAVEKKLKEIIQYLLAMKDEGFGNAGEMRNIADALERKWSVRITKEKLSMQEALSLDDIPTRYGFYLVMQEEKTHEIMNELDLLVGLENIKSFFNKLVRQIKFEKIRSQNDLNESAGGIMKHLVFYGNPGTGKTTMARLVGKLYQSLGLLKSGHVVEVSRPDLIAGYVGQTAEKTLSKVKEALDGVLFIDEAYTLLSGDRHDFGYEVINTLTKAMEDYKDRLLVIMAGYPAPMQKLLQANPGLLSRFHTPLEFMDYSNEELLQIFKNRCLSENFLLGDGADEVIFDYIKSYRQKTGNDFGNARFILNLFNQVKANLADRVIQDDLEENLNGTYDESVFNTIQSEDIPVLFRKTEEKIPIKKPGPVSHPVQKVSRTAARPLLSIKEKNAPEDDTDAFDVEYVNID